MYLRLFLLFLALTYKPNLTNINDFKLYTFLPSLGIILQVSKERKEHLQEKCISFPVLILFFRALHQIILLFYSGHQQFEMLVSYQKVIFSLCC